VGLGKKGESELALMVKGVFVVVWEMNFKYGHAVFHAKVSLWDFIGPVCN